MTSSLRALTSSLRDLISASNFELSLLSIELLRAPSLYSFLSLSEKLFKDFVNEFVIVAPGFTGFPVKAILDNMILFSSLTTMPSLFFLWTTSIGLYAIEKPSKNPFLILAQVSLKLLTLLFKTALIQIPFWSLFTSIILPAGFFVRFIASSSCVSPFIASCSISSFIVEDSNCAIMSSMQVEVTMSFSKSKSSVEIYPST